MSPLDAGAKAWFDLVQVRRLDAGRRRPDGERWQWEDLTEDDKTAYRAIARPIVSAALAEFWEEGKPGPSRDGGISLTANEAKDFLAAARA